MPIVTINNLGSLGTIKDTPAYELPFNAWSDSLNTRIKDGSIKSSLGREEINEGTAVSPFYLDHFISNDVAHLIYGGLNKIYSVSAGVHTDRTRAVGGDYNAAAGGWTGGILGGVPILNNKNNLPQSFNSVTGLFQNLPAWDTTVTARVMRPFREFLVALDVTKGSGTTRFPHLVKWSHPTDPGTVPISWDETDPSKDAGEFSLVDTGGACVDLVPMRDFAIVYKVDSLYTMQFVGAPFIFKFNKLSFGHGLLAPGCTADVDNGHFVVSNEDIIWHNGVRFKQIGPKRVNDWVFNNINRDFAFTSYVAVDRREQKVWFCFPTLGHNLPNLALIWDYPSDTFMIQDVPETAAMHYGLITETPPVADVWDSSAGSWDSDAKTWGQRNLQNLGFEFMAAQPSVTTPKLFSYSRGNLADGTPQLCYVERTGLPIAGQDKDGTPILDLDSWKLFRAIWPKVKITPGASITIRVGSQTVVGGPVTWAGPFLFNPATDNKINCLVSGRFLCMRFETEADVAWELTGYDVDVEITGKY